MTTLLKSATTKSTAKRHILIDCLLLFLLFVSVVVLMVGTLRALHRRLFGSVDLNGLSRGCLVLDDPATGARARPNSICSYKRPDSALTEYRFNNCGDRSDIPCGPKAPDTYRIVLLGTSYPEGMSVPWEETFAATLPVDLSENTGRKVELYNRALELRTPLVVDRHFQETLKLKPDLVLYALTAWDVTHSDEIVAQAPPRSFFSGQRQAGLKGKISRAIEYVIAGKLTMDKVILPFQPDVWRHYLFYSQSIYVKLSLSGEVDYMRTNPGSEWKKELQATAAHIADIEQQARAAGAPLVVTVLPQGPQATLISMREWPTGYDPYLLGESIRAMVEKDGGIYIDMLSGFRSVPNAERLYYRVDDHPNPDGQQYLSGALAKTLGSGIVPGLRPKTQPPTNPHPR